MFSGDGRVYWPPKDGKTRWVYQRTNHAAHRAQHRGRRDRARRGVLRHGRRPAGRARPRDRRAVGWEATATPKRRPSSSASPTSRASRRSTGASRAAAYQGRTACFDVVRGAPVWSRDIGSLGGIRGRREEPVCDRRRRRGCTRSTDRDRRVGVEAGQARAAQDRRAAVVGDYVGVVDVEGYLHLISPINGAYVGRLATDGSAPSRSRSLRQRGRLAVAAGTSTRSVRALDGGAARRTAPCSRRSRSSDARTSASRRCSTG